ncbi:MAG: N-acetylmuramoyl-L-alanine amidase [candidate division KSB1 bacterium]|nr:N-acetylmuramoyl-L-alanine amidase [candidate division KSB1 bacterium]
MEHDYQQILVALTAALGLAFAIERVLQVVKTLFDKVLFHAQELTPQRSAVPERLLNELISRHQQEDGSLLAEELEATRARLAREGEALPRKEREALATRVAQLEQMGLDTSKAELEEVCPEGTALVDEMPPPDRLKVLRTFWLQMVGAFAGVVVCSVSHFGLLARLIGGTSGVPVRLDWVLSGILIGAGAQPIHFLIEFITRRKITALKSATAEEEAGAEELRARSPGAVGSLSATSIVRVPYDGGVDVQELEYIHRRPANPDLIVFHHTGMHSDTSFAEVRSLIKQKGWVTGYHCVVLADGTICGFCRWDRYGNHVRGYNLRSLGIALHGNFETDPAQPFANWDGRYGLLAPSEAQLDAAARVVALWTFLYNIPLAFDSAIVPHSALVDTACPGSNFPIALFQELIATYRRQWESSEQARQEIVLFQKKPFLYV